MLLNQAVAAPLPRSQSSARGRRRIGPWPVFGPGRWRGEFFNATDIRELVDNFYRFKKPMNTPSPFYEPFVSINHNDETRGLVEGEVISVGQGMPGYPGWFWVLLEVNEPTAAAMDSGRLPHASIEFWDTWQKSDAELSGFPYLPDGKRVGRILSAVTLAGALPPAVKGQPRPPQSQPAPDRRFSNSPTRSLTVRIPSMDPMQDLIAKFKAAVPGLTDEQYTQLAQASMGGDDAAPAPDAMMGDAMAADPMAADASSMGAMPQNAAMDAPPADKMFSDPKFQKAVQQAVQKALVAEKAKEVTASTAEGVKKFCDTLKTGRHVTPAEADRLQAELLGLSPAARELSLATLSKIHKIEQPLPKADRKFASNPAGVTAGNTSLVTTLMTKYPAMSERVAKVYAARGDDGLREAERSYGKAAKN
jgi:hypothetical protein